MNEHSIPPFCWRAFWGWRCQWVIIQLAMVWTGEWERMSYNFPTAVFVLDWVIELNICCPGVIWLIRWSWYGTRTDKVGLGLYQCPFEEFHLKIFKYMCPVWVCCHVNVWVIMHTSGSKSLISSAVSIVFWSTFQTIHLVVKSVLNAIFDSYRVWVVFLNFVSWEPLITWLNF